MSDRLAGQQSRASNGHDTVLGAGAPRGELARHGTVGRRVRDDTIAGIQPRTANWVPSRSGV